MTIELTPQNVACNIACDYCYQKPQRDAGNVSRGADLQKMRAALQREGGPFSVFGGEPLLTPIPMLREIFSWGLEWHGQNGVQTNGTLITDEHLTMFQEYKVHVGLSLDGPGELNDSRWAGTLEKTRALTEKSMSALYKLCALGRAPSVIVTLYRGNAVGERLERLCEWLTEIGNHGVRHVRLHLLEVDDESIRASHALTTEENVAALLRLYEFEKTSAIRFDIFREMRRLLLGDDNQTTCIWNACDPYTTAAVRGVNGQGESSNCGRTNKEGVDWQKANTPGHERQVVLHRTPQSDLGCQGCRFFFACKGQCPGTAEHGDWRNRSEHCAIWMALFEHLEAELLEEGKPPLSLSPLLPQLEATMLRHWERGENISIARALTATRHDVGAIRENQEHGDHYDCPDGYQHADGVLTLHGDQGRTDMHGDSDREGL